MTVLFKGCNTRKKKSIIFALFKISLLAIGLALVIPLKWEILKAYVVFFRCPHQVQTETCGIEISKHKYHKPCPTILEANRTIYFTEISKKEEREIS